MSKFSFAYRVAAAGLLAAVVSQPASAADLWGPRYEGSIKDAPPAYAFTWTGVYVGAHAGLMTGNTQSCLEDCKGFAQIFATDYDMNGGLFGGHIGYNHQFGSAVLGIEASYSGSTAQGDGPSAWLTSHRQLDWLAIGYAMGRSMVYAMGGVVWGELQTDVGLGGGNIFLSGDETHVGWTAGLGVEHALTDRVTVRLEYAHIDLGSEDHTLKPSPLKTDVEAEFDTLSLGVSYKF